MPAPREPTPRNAEPCKNVKTTALPARKKPSFRVAMPLPAKQPSNVETKPRATHRGRNRPLPDWMGLFMKKLPEK
ncbi:hypothetical protein OH491_00635 [Termitidicoccus mucosus]|uniref:hypothetical protein n=1 Tax=Termitidicoccus mucosus TaxID=1184151 RepID=UPI002FEE0413